MRDRQVQQTSRPLIEPVEGSFTCGYLQVDLYFIKKKKGKERKRKQYKKHLFSLKASNVEFLPVMSYFLT